MVRAFSLAAWADSRTRNSLNETTYQGPLTFCHPGNASGPFFALQQVWAQSVLAADLGLGLDSTEPIKDQASLELGVKMTA